MLNYCRYKVIEMKKINFLTNFNLISQIIQFCEIFYVQYYAVICLFTAF